MSKAHLISPLLKKIRYRAFNYTVIIVVVLCMVEAVAVHTRISQILYSVFLLMYLLYLTLLLFSTFFCVLKRHTAFIWVQIYSHFFPPLLSRYSFCFSVVILLYYCPLQSTLTDAFFWKSFSQCKPKFIITPYINALRLATFTWSTFGGRSEGGLSTPAWIPYLNFSYIYFTGLLSAPSVL